jgi:hypothetical protein
MVDDVFFQSLYLLYRSYEDDPRETVRYFTYANEGYSVAVVHTRSRRVPYILPL